MIPHFLLLLLLLPLSLSHRLNLQQICLSQPQYICILTSTPGNQITGTIRFKPFFKPSNFRGKCVLHITATITGLSPGPHGFHIHTYGDATSADATSAGGHFTNPRGTDIPHGFPDSPIRHWGDLGNVTPGENGVVRYVAVDQVARYRRVLGRSIVLHEGPDLGPAEQPSGAAGARVASCVIGIANPELIQTG